VAHADIGHEKLESLAILMNMEQSNCRPASPFCSNTDLDQSLASHTEMISVRRSSNDRYFCLLLSPESSFGRHCPMGENNFRFCYYWLLQCDLRIVALYLLNASMTLPPFEHHQTNGFSLMLSKPAHSQSPECRRNFCWPDSTGSSIKINGFYKSVYITRTPLS
jgi:hypothetical protein